MKIPIYTEARKRSEGYWDAYELGKLQEYFKNEGMPGPNRGEVHWIRMINAILEKIVTERDSLKRRLKIFSPD